MCPVARGSGPPVWKGCGVGGGGVCEKCVCGLKGNMMARFNMHISLYDVLYHFKMYETLPYP